MDQQYEFRLAEEAVRRRARTPRARRAGRRTPPAVPVVTELAEKGLAAKNGSHAVKSKGLFLPPDATADEAFRLTLQHCKWHILANVPAVVEAREVEGVHQLRVALRRLRVALAAFGHEFRTPPIEALRMRAKILAQGLAPARDMDVFLDELFEPAAADSSMPDAFAVLRARAEARRKQAWEDAVREASGLAFHTFVSDLGEAIDQRHWYDLAPGAEPGENLNVFEMPARALAAKELAKHLKKAKKRAKGLEQLSEPERHKLRIALKQLRYSLEFFASLFAADAVKPFQKRLAAMQDILGLLQDVAVARATLKHLVEDDDGALLVPRGDISFAAGTVYGWHLDRAASAWQDAMARWKRFAKLTPFWEAV